MNWSDELRGRLELIDARLTAIERMEVQGTEILTRMQCASPTPAEQLVGKNDHPDSVSIQALG